MERAQSAQKGKCAGDIISYYEVVISQEHITVVIDVIFDLAQICHDLFMGPTFEGSPQIDTADFAEYTSIDSFGIVTYQSAEISKGSLRQDSMYSKD